MSEWMRLPDDEAKDILARSEAWAHVGSTGGAYDALLALQDISPTEWALVVADLASQLRKAQATPDLHDACERAEFWLSTHPEGAEMQKVLQAALDKAEGRKP